MEKLKKRVQQLKKKRPGYKEILDFYQKVREEQEKIKTVLKVEPILLKKEWKELLAKEGFSLIEKKDFPLDIEASSSLFQSLCEIGKEANPHLTEQVKKIEEALNNQNLNVKGLLKEQTDERKVEEIAREIGLDQNVLLFFVHSSIQPSIEAGVKQLLQEIDKEAWLKGSCPICGSLPHLSLLTGEVGKRYLLCSYCGYQWRAGRLFCPFCNNDEQSSLHYFYAEGEESFRIDLCDKCRRYIKTIDGRKIDAFEPMLEDLASLHLDISAIQKGYKRPVPTPWINE